MTRELGDESLVWVPLTLEPGQVIVRFSGPKREGSHPREVTLGLRGTAGRPARVELETVEYLQPERGRYRVETLNVFLPGDLSALLQRRTVVARIESSRPVKRVYSSTHAVSVARKGLFTSELALDASGSRAAGQFRFFYSLGDDDEPDIDATGLTAGLPVQGPRLSDRANEFVEPRRTRLRRRASLRRLP
jgi:hypothetical protein